MLAYLLARAGVDVLVLEKHADFLRDFRGDTIHPSTLELMHELRLLEEFLQRPHDEVRQLNGWIGESLLCLADFAHLPTHCKFIAFMPQWDFLDFLADQARRYPSFSLLMNTEATDLLVEDALVTGVRAKSAQGQLEIRAGLTELAPFLRHRVEEIADWEQIKLLTVVVDRLKRWWRPGLLCIGDAAHAMSPVGGVGINLAIQDAVAAANILAGPLRTRAANDDELAGVQGRREFPTRATQRMQIAVQNNMIKRVLGSTHIKAPWILKLVDRWPLLQRIPARLIGMGFRPEHVKTPDAQALRYPGRLFCFLVSTRRILLFWS